MGVFSRARRPKTERANGYSRMRDSDFGVTSGDEVDELAQALEKGDHGHVEPAILEQARDGEIARAVPR